MKLSKTAWWILGIGFFVIALVTLVMFYVGNSNEAKQLEDSLQVNEGLLIQFRADREALDSELLQMQEQLDETEVAYNQNKANFSKVVRSIEYDQEIFSIANDNDLDVLSLIAEEPFENTLDEIIFKNTVFTVEVQGTVQKILTFIHDVAAGSYFESAGVEMVDMEVPEADQEGEPSAIIEIIIYSYEGE
jgi:hypothetical protein